MTDFDREKFIEFIKTFRLTNRIVKSKELQYLQALSQFEVSIADFVKNRPATTYAFIKRNFKELNKPYGLSYHIYLLYLFGYKKCTNCKEILNLNNFTSDVTTWSGLDYKCKECLKEYKTNNKPKYAAHEANRRAIKLKATLPGFDKQIEEFYKNCPSNNHVDHIVPLQGKYVCGLHVPINLQYLPIKENFKKNNYHESEEAWK